MCYINSNLHVIPLHNGGKPMINSIKVIHLNRMSLVAIKLIVTVDLIIDDALFHYGFIEEKTNLILLK